MVEAAAEMVETPLRQDGHQTQESFFSSAVFFFFFSFSRWRLNVAVSIQGRNPSLPALNLPPPRPVAGGQVESKVGVAVGSCDRRRLIVGSRNKKKQRRHRRLWWEIASKVRR